MKKYALIFLIACAAGSTVVVAQDNAPFAGIAKAAEGKTITVTGVVLCDATGRPVAGASITVVGYPYSAMTDDNGQFTLKVPAASDAVGAAAKNCELKVDAPTYAGTLVPLRGESHLSIRLMDESYRHLSNHEVLTPFGMREYSHLTTALSFVEEDNSISSKAMPEAMLQGNAAGLGVNFRSGADATGANLVLRGYNSIYTNNSPLLIIDGMVIENQQFGMSLIEGQISTPLGCIDVKDIDQITVLKDASTIYGAKGANGAILIQTKRTTDQATHIDVTALCGINMQPKSLPVLGAADAKRYLTEVAQSSGLSAKEVSALSWVNASLPNRLPNGTYEHSDYYKYNGNTDWQDEIYQTGFKQQYSLNVSGGDETAIYGVSMGFQNKDGLIKGTDYQRFNARVNAAIKFTDRIRLNANMNFVYGVKNMANEGTASVINPIYTALTKAPFTSPHSISELNISSPAYEDVDALGAANPAVVTSDMVDENSFYRFMGSYNVTATLAKDWTLNSNFGLDFNKEREVIFYPSTGIPYGTLSNAEINNEQMHGVERMFNLFNETRLNYTKQVGDHAFDVTAGFRYMHCTAEDDYGHGYNSASNYYQTLGSGDAALYQNGGAIGNWNWFSFYGNLDYNYKNRFFVNAILSSDASSRYGDDVAPLQVYPGLSVAWLITSESFMKDCTLLNLLKLRASGTMAGNDDIGNYNAKRYYISTAFLTNNGLVRGNLLNNNLKPERITKMNVGLDLSMLNERLNITFDAYQNTTKNLLIYSNATSFSGFANYVSNGGELENKGFDMTLSGRIINKRDFSWDLSLTMAHNKNKVKALDCGTLYTSIGDGIVRTQVGSPIGIFYGYKTDGVYSTTAEAQADGKSSMVGAVATPFQAGDVRFVDVVNDGIIDDKDRVDIGDPNPDFFGGFTSVMKSHHFTLTAQFTYSYGNDVYNYTRSRLENMSTYANQTKAVLNRWRTEGDVTSMPRAQYGDPMGNSRFSDRWIEDGSFLKFKNLTLSYDIPMTSSVFTGITVYGTVENLCTFTDYKGYDPEIISSSSNNPLYQGVDAFTTPTTRTFFIGLKIGL